MPVGYNPAVAAKRRPKLGQHFLVSEVYRCRIADALRLGREDLVIEIGPGRGAMTELLAERAGRVLAVELDASLARALRAKHRPQASVEIIQGDILSTDLGAICRERAAHSCSVFGNLPYYITSPILHHLMNSAPVIREMALLVQREVAERITARPGSRDYGYLTVLAELHAETRIALRVPPGAFSPPPKVHSALVDFRMRPKFPQWRDQERAKFLDFIHKCFAHKRKTLLNNLGALHGRDRVVAALAQLQIPATARAEEVSVEQFAAMFGYL